MQVVIINGVGGCGKDTFVSLCRTYLMKYSVYNFSTIDAVKDVARQLFWDGEKNEAGRTFLYELKKAWKKYNNGPVTTLIRKISEIEQDDRYLNRNSLVFIHCREEGEIEEFKDIFFNRKIPVATLFINRRLKEHTNPSDRVSSKNYSYDYVINNDGTLEELSKKAENFLKYLGYID